MGLYDKRNKQGINNIAKRFLARKMDMYTRIQG